MIITGVISEKQALNSIDLKTIFLFGGTLSLAAALEKTGAGEMVAEKVMHLLGENPSPYVLTFAVFMLCCIMTNFMSNTATTALLVPSVFPLHREWEQIQEPYLWLALSAVPARMQHLLECRQIPWYLEQAVTLLRLYKVRTAVNCDRDHSQHDHFTNCIDGV